MIMAPENRIYFRRTDALKAKYITNIKESTFKSPLTEVITDKHLKFISGKRNI